MTARSCCCAPATAPRFSRAHRRAIWRDRGGAAGGKPGGRSTYRIRISSIRPGARGYERSGEDAPLMATLDLDDISKIYPGSRDRAVDHVSMKIEDGEIIALLGSSGCGKTSTLRMVAGFESVTEGTVKLGDRIVNNLKPAERNIAMAFEG